MRYHFRVIRIIETSEAFDSLQPVWDSLARMPQQSFAWCRAGWAFLRREDPGVRLFIPVSYDEPDRIHLILPTYLDGSGTLRFILDTFSDHCDVLMPVGANLTIAWREVLKTLHAARAVRFIRLRRLPPDSPLLHALGAAAEGAVLFREGASLAVDLAPAGTLEAALPHLYSRDRDKLHRALRALSGYTFSRYDSARRDPFPRERLLALKAAMVAQGLRPPGFLTEAFLDFAGELYRRGLCEVVSLTAPDAGEALNLNLRFGKTTLLWVILYSDHRLPSLMGVACAQDLRPSAPCRLDFGAGVYGYKCGALRPRAEVAFTLCLGKGFCGWLRAIRALLWRHAKDGVKRLRARG